MPFHRASSFLQLYCRGFKIQSHRCQCPFIGLPHFYAEGNAVFGYSLDVSMPFHRATSFLLVNDFGKYRPNITVSMPFLRATSFLLHRLLASRVLCKAVSMPFLRASSFLQRELLLSVSIRLTSVNALSSGFLISTVKFYGVDGETLSVSMPFHRASSFLQKAFVEAIYHSMKCQCPFIGLPHFYGYL